MKIWRDPASRLWTLSSGGEVLYAGRRSPWENPRLMRAALERERDAHEPAHGRRREHGAAAGRC
jgi:hypothetical protein